MDRISGKPERIAAHRHKGAILAVCFAAIAVVMVLTSTILFMVQLDATSTDRMEARYETARQIRGIGDRFVAGKLTETSYGEYTCETATDPEDSRKETLTVTRTENGGIVLRVTVLTGTDGTRGILLWDTTTVAPSDTESDTGAP